MNIVELAHDELEDNNLYEKLMGIAVELAKDQDIPAVVYITINEDNTTTTKIYKKGESYGKR